MAAGRVDESGLDGRLIRHELDLPVDRTDVVDDVTQLVARIAAATLQPTGLSRNGLKFAAIADSMPP